MTARKSLPQYSTRLSRLSIRSQASGVLDSDSNVNSDDEGNPLWYRDFENYSIRPSARFSLARNETPVLESNSEPESTPLQKNWWGDLQDTPDIRFGKSNATEEKSNAEEQNNSGSPDTSSFEENIPKRRIPLRRNRRKSLQRNVFSDILDSSKTSNTSRNVNQSLKNPEKQVSSDISHTDTDISLEKARFVPLRKRKRTKLLEKPSNVESKSDETSSDVFRDALDAVVSDDDKNPETAIVNEPETSQKNRDTSIRENLNNKEIIRSEIRSPVEDDLDDANATGETLERSTSPVLMKRSKKRPQIGKATNRKSANFDDLLNDVSEEEVPPVELPLVGADLESERNQQRQKSAPELDLRSDIPAPEDDSDMEDSMRKRRVPFPSGTRKSQSEDVFTAILESPNTSIRSGLSSAQKRTPRNEIPESRIERRSSKRKSNLLESSITENYELEENQSAIKSRQERRSENRKEDMAEASTSHHSNVESEENQAKKTPNRRSKIPNNSDALRRSPRKRNDRGETSDLSNVDFERNQSGPVRLLQNRSNDSARPSGSPIVEKRRNLSTSLSPRPSARGNNSEANGRSINKSRDHTRTSESLNDEMEENEFVNTPTRRSTGFKKPRDVTPKKKLSSDNLSRRVSRRSISKEFLVSNEIEEEEEEEISRSENPQNISDPIDRIAASRKSPRNSRSQTSRNDDEAITVPVNSTKDNTNQRMKASSRISTEMPEEISENLRAFPLEIEPRSRIIEPTTQNERIVPDRSFSSIDYDRPMSSQQADISSRILSQGVDVDRLKELKKALNEKNKKAIDTIMKNTKINDYFKKTSATKPPASSNVQEKVGSKIKPKEKENKVSQAPPNKAYIINGKVYKRPRLPRPKQWATDRLYKYLWKKMEPKYQLKTRIRSEKFILDLSNVITLISRRKKYDNYKAELNGLIHEMARLGIIKTRNDFHIFCQNYLPFDFRIKVVPMILPGNVRNIPFHPDKLHTPIIPL